MLIGGARRDNHADHLAKSYELLESEADGEEQSGAEQTVDQHVAPEDRIDEIDDSGHGPAPFLFVTTLGNCFEIGNGHSAVLCNRFLGPRPSERQRMAVAQPRQSDRPGAAPPG